MHPRGSPKSYFNNLLDGATAIDFFAFSRKVDCACHVPQPRCPSTRGFFFVLDARIRVEKALRAGAVQGGLGSGCPGDEVVMARATRNRRPSRAVNVDRATIINSPISRSPALETPEVPLWGLFGSRPTTSAG